MRLSILDFSTGPLFERTTGWLFGRVFPWPAVGIGEHAVPIATDLAEVMTATFAPGSREKLVQSEHPGGEHDEERRCQ